MIMLLGKLLEKKPIKRACFTGLWIFLFSTPKANYFYRKEVRKKILILACGRFLQGAMLNPGRPIWRLLTKSWKKNWGLKLACRRLVHSFLRTPTTLTR